MPVLVPGAVTRSRAATMQIDNQLAEGSWRFRLTVVDDSGLESAPTELVLRVIARVPPIRPVITPVRPAPLPILPVRPIRRPQ